METKRRLIASSRRERLAQALSAFHFQSCTSRAPLPELHFQRSTFRVALPGASCEQQLAAHAAQLEDAGARLRALAAVGAEERLQGLAGASPPGEQSMKGRQEYEV